MMPNQTIFHQHQQLHEHQREQHPKNSRNKYSYDLIEDFPQRPVKRTRFSDTSTLVVFPPRSDEDIHASWYTKQDLAGFKQDIRKSTMALRTTRTAKAMKRIAFSIASGSSSSEMSSVTRSTTAMDLHIHGIEHIRGLEHLLSPDVLKVIIHRRRMNIARVLQEQEMQTKVMGKYDPSNILGQVSERNSLFSREWSCQISNLH